MSVTKVLNLKKVVSKATLIARTAAKNFALGEKAALKAIEDKKEENKVKAELKKANQILSIQALNYSGNYVEVLSTLSSAKLSHILKREELKATQSERVLYHTENKALLVATISIQEKTASQIYNKLNNAYKITTKNASSEQLEIKTLIQAVKGSKKVFPNYLEFCEKLAKGKNNDKMFFSVNDGVNAIAKLNLKPLKAKIVRQNKAVAKK
jgi:hypothetical protein